MSEQAAAATAAPEKEKQRRRQTSHDKRPKRQPRYNVVLWDSDQHTYAYVVGMLGELFHYPTEKAYQLAVEVDTSGKAIVMTTTMEHAELKRDQIRAYGKDDLMENCKGSMHATIEPVPGEGE